MEGSAKAHYLGTASGETFLDACKNYIKDVAKSMLTVMGMSMQAIGVVAGSQHLQRHSVRSTEMEVLS